MSTKPATVTRRTVDSDCEKHGRTKFLYLEHENLPCRETPVCMKCLAESMVQPIRRSESHRDRDRRMFDLAIVLTAVVFTVKWLLT